MRNQVEWVVQFPHWPDVLEASPLSSSQKQSITIMIRWYLKYCKQSQLPASKRSAEAFIEWVDRSKKPSVEQLAEWIQSLRWFS